MVAVAIGGAAVVGAGATIATGSKAAKAQKYAADQSAETQRYMYDTTRSDYAPYRDVGNNALYKLADMYGVGHSGGMAGATGAAGASGTTGDYGGFQASPGYQFRKDQAIGAVKANASARGLLGSTASANKIAERVDGLASSEYDSFANRLASLAGIGQSATGGTAAAGQSAANGISAAQQAAGNARASAYANTGSAINSGAQNLASLYLYQHNGGFGGGGGGYDTSYQPSVGESFFNTGAEEQSLGGSFFGGG